jgi:RES domain-containing protein
MKSLWRISNHHDLSGRGGLIAPGRWNSIGSRVVYLAESAAGALLEHLVHLAIGNGALPRTYSLLTISIPDDLTSVTLQPAELQEWQTRLDLTQALGDSWLAGMETPLALVPSAIVPHTWNLMLNPLHPDAGQATIVAATRQSFDPRLFQFGPR